MDNVHTPSPGKHPGGRPTAYRDEYCDQVIEHCSNGSSLTSFAAKVGVCRNTIDIWRNAHPEFLGACARAKAASGAWWENVLRNNAVTGDGNAASAKLGILNMARDDWEDASHVDVTSKGESVAPKPFNRLYEDIQK